MSRSLRWFEVGASALARLGRTEGDHYACPLCLRVFGRDQLDQLSEEHVPPRSLGGKALVLTCKKCNNEGGAKVDAHAARQQKAERIVARQDKGPSRARVSIGGVSAVVDVRTDAGILVAHRPDLNHPATGNRLIMEFVDAIRNRQIPPITLNYNLGGTLDLHQAGVSWLRAAYLAVFAALGYSFILRPVFNPIRRQILYPQELHIQRHTIFLPIDEDPGTKYLLFVKEPAWLKALAVRLGTRVVLLPVFDDSSLPYTELEQRLERGDDLSIRGDSGFPWPVRPEHRFDVAEAEEISAIEHFIVRSCHGPVTETTSNRADG